MMRQSSERNGDADHTARCDYQGHFLFVQMNLSHLEPAQAEAFWSELAAWLFDRGLYLGGDASAAVVYAPRRGYGPPTRIWQTLRRRLEVSLGRRVRIAVHVVGRELATPAPELAALEAVRNAQSALIEAAGTCGEDLERLLVGLARRSGAGTKRRG